jgi:uncharacterized Tic20 family protein
MPEKNQDQPEETPEAIPNPSPANEEEVLEPKASEAAPAQPPTQVVAVQQPRPVTPNEERTWAMLAHLSVLLNLVTGFLGGIAAIIIYFIYKDRSRLVAYHAMQAFLFQAITWLGASLVSGFLIAIGGALGFLIIPLLCLIPGFLILLLIPISLIYGIIGGVKVNNGEDFRYWLVGDWVRDILEPKAPTV